jgi:polysaccharide export outer membrane protein
MSGDIRHQRIRSASARSAFAAGVLLFSIPAARAEYHLSPGDSLDIAVAGIPDLKNRIVVQADGSISFPLLGTIKVTGLSASDASAKIKAGLAAKVFRQRAPDGRESVTVIEPDQVSATIGELRPVIVNGDVSKPGEQRYRPSITVREAVALSGGYDTMHFRTDGNPFLISADLRGQYEEQWTEFVKEQAAIWRVQNELGRQAQFDQKVLADVPIPRSTIAGILALESEQLQEHQADFDREKKFVQTKITQTDGHIKVVSDELEKDEQGLVADAQDVQRLSELAGKGLLSMPRMADARRAVLFSSTRKLQTTSQLMKLQNDRLELSRQGERLDEQRKSDLLRDLQERNVRLSEIRARLASIEDKLRYTGILKSQLVSGTGDKPDITVVRKTESGREHIAADEDYELEPGDVVEIALRHRPLDVSSMK